MNNKATVSSFQPHFSIGDSDGAYQSVIIMNFVHKNQDYSYTDWQEDRTISLCASLI